MKYKKDSQLSDFPKGAERPPLLDILETSKQKSWWEKQIELSKKENRETAEELEKLKYENDVEEAKWFKKAKNLRRCKVAKDLFISNRGYIELHKRCKYRICRVCSIIRQINYFDLYCPILEKRKIAKSINHDGLRLLTFTIKNQKDLVGGIDKLYDSFGKFKRRKYFNEIITKKGVKKKRIRGGVGSFHIKKGKKDNTKFNHHIHMLIDSSYLDMKSHKNTGEDSKLVKEWKACTGDSGILDVRKIKDRQEALNYVLHYITKGLEVFTPKEKAIFFKATSGRRLLFTFGDFYGVKKPKKKSDNKLQYIKPESEEWNMYHGLPIEKERPKY